MSGGPRTLFAAVLLAASFAVGGCSAESSSSPAQGDASPDPGATSTAGGDTDGLAGGSGKGADEEVETDGPPDGSGDGDDDRDGADGASALRKETASYLRDAARALHKGGDGDGAMRDTATGAALDAALAQAAEFQDNGWHQVGVPRVVDLRVVEDRRDDDPPRMTVSACVDSSEVDVVDASGESVRHGSHAERSRMIYTLVRKRGDWLVERQSFPDNPDC